MALLIIKNKGSVCDRIRTGANESAVVSTETEGEGRVLFSATVSYCELQRVARQFLRCQLDQPTPKPTRRCLR